jgi:F-type H+-transporting ATPase subunit gamma
VASVQDIARRVRSVKNTRKITKAMELVSAAKLRRAQTRIEAMRPYADRMLELMGQTARSSSSLRGLTLLERREEKRVAILAVTADRGLAGAFNAQVLRRGTSLLRELDAEGKDVVWLVTGKKGRPTYADAQAIAHRLTELYASGEVDRVVLIYNAYVSPLVQRVTVRDLLPISDELLAEGEGDADKAIRGDTIFEPEPEEILARLLPTYLETELYRALLESAASEHGARMSAMRNASKNAGELIDRLTLAMNRARQAEITQEILEVVAGADALTA